MRAAGQRRQGAGDERCPSPPITAASRLAALPPATLLLFYLPVLQLFTGSKQPPANAEKAAAEARGKMAVARSTLLRANGSFLPEPAFRQRKAFFAAKVNAGLQQ